MKRDAGITDEKLGGFIGNTKYGEQRFEYITQLQEALKAKGDKDIFSKEEGSEFLQVLKQLMELWSSGKAKVGLTEDQLKTYGLENTAIDGSP